MLVHTSVCIFGTEPVLPFAMAELELLGLLGPEPGALLQRDDTGRDRRHTETGKEREKQEVSFSRVFRSVFLEVWASSNLISR